MPPTVIKLNGFRYRNKILCLDYDWTLVIPKTPGSIFPKSVDDWTWSRSTVPSTLESMYKKGYCLIVTTNQSKPWKVDQIRQSLTSLNLPVLIIIATDKSDYKPNKSLLTSNIPSTKLPLTSQSMYIGDALGRPNDHSDDDLQFAVSLGFKTIKAPEDFFPTPTKSPTQSPAHLAISSPQSWPSAAQEIVVLVGYPGSGKTSLASTLFPTSSTSHYVTLHGDELKTSAKMIKASLPLISSGKSIVFDATNPSKEKRQEYIKLAAQHSLPARCIHVSTSFGESLMRNNKRPKDQIVPKIVFSVYRKKFDPPTVSEGFTEVLII